MSYDKHSFAGMEIRATLVLRHYLYIFINRIRISNEASRYILSFDNSYHIQWYDSYYLFQYDLVFIFISSSIFVSSSMLR